MISLLVTLALFPLVGLGAAALFRLSLPRAIVTRVAMCFLFGVGVNGTLLYLLGTIGVPLTLLTFAAIPLIAVAAGRTTIEPETRERHVIAGLVFALPLALLLAAGAILPVRDYDGRVTWLPKARAIAHEASVRGPFFQGQRGLNLHNEYPLLMPLNAAAVMRLTGDSSDESPRWLYLFTIAAGLVLLRDRLIRRFGTTGAWTAASTAWLPILGAIEGGALSAYNDLPLAAFAGVAMLELLDRKWLAAGLFLAFAVLAKNEGAALAIAVSLAALLVRRPKWVPYLSPIVFAVALHTVWRTFVPAAYDEQYNVLLAELPASLPRAPEAIRALLAHALRPDEWAWFWPATLLATIIGLMRRRWREIAMPVLTIALASGAYVAALMVTSWNIADLAPVAANRLLSHLLVPAAWVIAASLAASHPPPPPPPPHSSSST